MNLLAVIWSPRGAFQKLGKAPRGVVWWLVFSLLAVGPGVAFAATVDIEAFIVKQMRASGQWENLPDEQRDQVRDFVPKLYTFGAPAGAVFKRALWIFALALLGWAFLREQKKDEDPLPLGLFLAAMALATVPLLISDLLRTLVYALKDQRTFDIANPVKSNLSGLLGFDATSGAGAALKRADLFGLWNVGLSVVGLMTVSGKRSLLCWVPPIGLYAGLWIMDVVGGLVNQAQGA